jgi:hypothetical protein
MPRFQVKEHTGAHVFVTDPDAINMNPIAALILHSYRKYC